MSETDLSAAHGVTRLHRNLNKILRRRLPQPAWALLQHAGQLADHHNAPLYLVGGCVRDLLLGVQNLDLDLVVEGDGIAFARWLSKEVQTELTVHERFGTATLVLPNQTKLDIATARTESYAHPAALPTVKPGSIQQDLQRRDFTINALAICLNANGFGHLVDAYGGQRDLQQKTICVLHDISFIDDPTRVFRAIRFAARYGFHLERRTAVLIAQAVKADVVHRLSGHRLLEELKLLLAERQPRKAVKRLAACGVLRFIHPKLQWSDRLDGLLKAVGRAVKWHRAQYPDRNMDAWLVYLMGLLEVLPEGGVCHVLKRFPFSETEAQALTAVRAGFQGALRRLSGKFTLKPSETYRLLSGLSDEILLGLMAKSKDDYVKRQVSAFLTTYQHIKPILTGDDLKKMGLKPGPKFRQILDRLLDARLNGEVQTEPEGRALVRRLANLPTGESPNSSA